MDWRKLRIVAFDTETTGLSPFDGDRVIEFAAVELFVDSHGRVVRTIPHAMLFNPGIPIPSKVVQLTGIDDAKVAKEPPFEERARAVRELLANSVCIAHNFPFDRSFLSVELQRAGLNWPDPVGEIDTVDLSIRHFPEAQSHKLGDLARRLDIRLDEAHRATHDAEACGRAFVEMARQSDAPSDLQGMLDWADALGHPPENPHIRVGPQGIAVFAEGPHAGQPVERHPVTLHWMTLAKTRQDGRWQYRYPESLRRWASRFLKVRGAGRARQAPKSSGPDDWGIDSNALPLPPPSRR